MLIFLFGIFICLATRLANGLEYQLVFSDEFDRKGVIDQAKWNIVDRVSEVNEELQWYKPDEVWTDAGFLFLRSRKRTVSDSSGTITRQYTSGRVDTKDKFELFYGEVEWRVQLPAGQGIWPALWLLQWQCPAASPCGTWPPEIDVIESRGDVPTRVTQYLHYGRHPNNGAMGHEHYGPDFTAAFHTFKVIWDPNQIVWFVDGQETYKITDKGKIPNEKMYLIMNVAVGGWYSGNPDASTQFPTHMLIDYVRVYRWQ